MRGYLSISEIAAKYGVSESTARRRMRGRLDAKPVRSEDGTHWTNYYPSAAVVEEFRKAR